jgi:hypothetical protein
MTRWTVKKTGGLPWPDPRSNADHWIVPVGKAELDVLNVPAAVATRQHVELFSPRVADH